VPLREFRWARQCLVNSLRRGIDFNFVIDLSHNSPGYANYIWRSTEPEENTNPDKYPAVFRLSPEKLSKLEVAPSIPPLRSKT
jgi:hypothetical protein